MLRFIYVFLMMFLKNLKRFCPLCLEIFGLNGHCDKTNIIYVSFKSARIISLDIQKKNVLGIQIRTLF